MQTSIIKNIGKVVSDILYKAGIDTKTFKAHSLRTASTSNAFKAAG